MASTPVLRWGLTFGLMAVLATVGFGINFLARSFNPVSYLIGVLLGILLALTWGNFVTAVRNR